MIRSTVLRLARAPLLQKRMSSGFNKYPVLKNKLFGISGNAMLASGFSFFLVAVLVVQKSGYLIPHTIGPGLSPVGRIEIDLTPDELKNR
ncbi:uncharacterized protein LOC120340976 [Styela clava]|uniref:uncharacterized protein LOC120340976 n=1 Tax=Styela clava TaxID=7725 RepID=UPI00193A30FC|nr:uncharacterized protein LOC120340976 [Styela clava]